MARTVLFAVLILATASATAAAQPSKDSALVSVAELTRILKDPSTVVLHIAERDAAFAEGHIPGARFVRYGDFAVDGPDKIGSELPGPDVIKRVFEAAGVSDNARVVVYGQSPVTAARAFFTLDAFGHTRVALLDGGLRAWKAANQPVASGGASAAPAGRFTPRLNLQRVAHAEGIQQLVPGKGISLVDVRPDDEFFGNNTMGGAHAAGHIEGARQLTWNSLVAPDGTFLPADQLRARLEAAGVVAGRPVVAYCMVGMRASVVYFVARHLGFDARLYDGSIVDWSRKNLPVTKQ